MFLDRALQLQILESLRESFPRHKTLAKVASGSDVSLVSRELFYLQGHGLVQLFLNEKHGPVKASNPYVNAALITSAGLDFLEADGGLTAILGKVVVKFDEDDFERLLAAIDDSSAEQSVKDNLKAKLRSLPAEGLKTVCTELLCLGVGNLQGVPQLVEKVFRQFG